MSADFLCFTAAAPSAALRILTGLRDCCLGAFEEGPAGCTCWEPVYDLEQGPLVVDAEVATRPAMCDDCAYRPGSPERAGDERYQCATEDGDVPDVPFGSVFFCHQGMRKPVAWRHRLGITVAADSDAYDPPMVERRTVEGRKTLVPFKADGTPGDRCAGWAAHAGEIGRFLANLAPAT